MSAEPLRRDETAEADNVVYVAPPWASRAGTPAPAPAPSRAERFAEAWAEWREHPIWGQLVFEAKALLAAVVLVALVWSGLPSLYQLKSRLGIDLVPGVHGPDVLPFLDR